MGKTVSLFTDTSQIAHVLRYAYTIPLFPIDLVNEYRGEEYLLENYHESLRLATPSRASSP